MDPPPLSQTRFLNPPAGSAEGRGGSLVKTTLSSGFLTTRKFSTMPQEPGHAHSVGFFRPQALWQTEETNVGKALSGRKIFRVWSLLLSETECPEKAGLDTKALVRGVIQNLGSRGQQRLTTWTCCDHSLGDEYSVIPPLTSSSEDGSLVHGLEFLVLDS